MRLVRNPPCTPTLSCWTGCKRAVWPTASRSASSSPLWASDSTRHWHCATLPGSALPPRTSAPPSPWTQRTTPSPSPLCECTRNCTAAGPLPERYCRPACTGRWATARRWQSRVLGSGCVRAPTPNHPSWHSRRRTTLRATLCAAPIPCSPDRVTRCSPPTTAGGDTVRVYLPYGSDWYAYLTRRLAERPENAAFFLRALLRSGD